jgi:hypothetical protein
VLWTTVPAASPAAVFTGESNRTYAFHSIARDAAGNVEMKSPSKIEASTYVPDLNPPDTRVTSVDATTATFTVQFSGTDTGGSGLSFFDVFVQVDGGAATQLGHFPAAAAGPGGVPTGATTYQALSDGGAHSYRFWSVGLDGFGNVEAAPTNPADDVVVTRTFSPPATLQVTGFDVQRGATQRSYVRYLTLTFNQSADLAALIAGGRIRLTRFDLNGSNGQNVSLASVTMTVTGSVLELDFGVQGMGGNRNSTVGDGYYALELDLDNNGSFATARTFYRLLGDINGDRVVDNTDIGLIGLALGRTGTNLNEDVNGDGVVNALDRALATWSRGRQLAAGLHLDD